MPDPQFELDPVAYRQMSEQVRVLLGIDLDSYKPQQVWRRVTSFARRHDLAGPLELSGRLRTDPALLASFRNLLTINVSEFFRDPAPWSDVGDRFLRPMLSAGRVVRVWSAGCSFGFEPLSIAILARELATSPAIRVLATDIDTVALERTRVARFSAAEIGQLSGDRRDRSFVPAGDGWAARPEVRQMITLRQHDLTADPAPGAFDLIVCRNVLIYLTEATKARVYPMFAEALRPGGVLFVGGTEIVPRPSAFGLRSDGRCLYVKD